MLLAIDVGNTQTVLGLFDGESLAEHRRLATDASRTGDELGALLGEMLDLESVDGICLSSTVPAQVREFELFAERWAKAPILVVEPGHRFAGRTRIRLDDISREQLVLFDRTSSYAELTNAVFRGAGVRPEAVMELDNIDAAKKMVQEGFGVALIPLTAVADELEAGLLCRVQIEDAEPLRRQIVAVRRRDRSAAGGAAESFLATLREMQPELSRS